VIDFGAPITGGSAASQRFGQALGLQGATFAAHRVECGRGKAGADELVETSSQLFSSATELLGKGHRGPAAGLPVEEKTLKDASAEHLFQAQGLRADLDLVAVIVLGTAAFIFDWRRLPPAAKVRQAKAALFVFRREERSEFDDVGLSDEAETQRADAKPTGNAEAGSRFPASFVGPVVEDLAFGCKAVLRPLLLNVDERALSRAEGEVLQPGQWQQVVFGEHWRRFSQAFSRMAIPSGSASLLITTSKSEMPRAGWHPGFGWT
jgi:hypothetical protein